MDATRKRSSSHETELKPYFQNERATLYCGEALRVLPRLPSACVAAAITDPPYSSGGQTAGERARDPREKYCHNGEDLGRPSFSGDNRDQRSFRMWATLWMAEAQRVLRPEGYCLVFSDWRQLPTMTDVLQAGGLIWRGVIAWDKGRGARSPHKGYFRHQCEYIAWATNGRCPKRLSDGPLDGCYRETVRQADKFHMTGKPTPLMRELVRCVDPDDLVLDPFAGSGTTGVACLQSGRRFVGIELSQAYCEIAARRLEAATAEGLSAA